MSSVVEGHQHDDAHGHPPGLAHHFDTPEQQFDSGKMGIWIFLLTEILFFSGLFCAYAVYRSNHPEIFIYAQKYLDRTLGAINTVVLIVSSLTMAWAVRCAQLNQQKGLVACLVITLVCAFTFMGIKAVEYNHKWHEGVLPGRLYHPAAHAEVEPGGQGPAVEPAAAVVEQAPRDQHIFFSVYFGMTGLHGLHVLAGIGVIIWLLVRALKGHFGPHSFAAVDYVALYWHLVDLVWIFLFPLLYLIH